MKAAVLVALLAGCAGPSICGDDPAIAPSGLHVEVLGIAGDVVYTVEVSAAGEVLAVDVGPDLRDPAPVVGDELTLRVDGFVDRLLVILEVGTTGPASATVTIRDGAATLATETFAPDYEVTYPEGPGCPAVGYAEAAMTL